MVRVSRTALPCPHLPCPTLPRPALSYPTLPYATLACPTLSYPIPSYSTQPTVSDLPYPVLRPTLPYLLYQTCPTLSYPVFSYPTLRYTILYVHLNQPKIIHLILTFGGL